MNSNAKPQECDTKYRRLTASFTEIYNCNVILIVSRTQFFLLIMQILVGTSNRMRIFLLNSKYGRHSGSAIFCLINFLHLTFTLNETIASYLLNLVFFTIKNTVI